MQTNLIGKQRTIVELKESYGGFDVINPDHIDFEDVTPKLVRSGEMITKQFDSYEKAKESFETQVRRIYQADIHWNKSKFQDSEGVFWLDGVKIKWELKTFYITDYHLEFNSAVEKTPSLLTETGYRSDFPSGLEHYDSVEEYITEFVEYVINKENGKDKKKPREYRLDWKDTGYNPSKQFTLIEMKGGEK